MANFQKHGKNVHGQTLQVPSGAPFELGLWGPVDTRNNKELTVSVSPDNPAISVRSGSMLKGQPVRVWTISNLPAGKTLLVAKDLGGLVWTQVTLEVGGSQPSTGPANGRRYTDNPNEVSVQRTTPTPKQVVDMLMSAWPGLNETGARVLTAQFMGETGDGRYCFNWNLGNVKSSSTANKHMYLANVWECIKDSNVDATLKEAGSLGRTVDQGSQEARSHGWTCKAGKSLVVFSPPHAQTRFRAYDSLQNGAERWVKHQQGTASKEPAYFPALNAGDIDTVVNCLDKVKYFSGSRDVYLSSMKRKKAQIDKQLGPVQS